MCRIVPDKSFIEMLVLHKRLTNCHLQQSRYFCTPFVHTELNQNSSPSIQIFTGALTYYRKKLWKFISCNIFFSTSPPPPHTHTPLKSFEMGSCKGEPGGLVIKKMPAYRVSLTVPSWRQLRTFLQCRSPTVGRDDAGWATTKTHWCVVAACDL